jgi:hypothetical protein
MAGEALLSGNQGAWSAAARPPSTQTSVHGASPSRPCQNPPRPPSVLQIVAGAAHKAAAQQLPVLRARLEGAAAEVPKVKGDAGACKVHAWQVRGAQRMRGTVNSTVNCAGP